MHVQIIDHCDPDNKEESHFGLKHNPYNPKNASTWMHMDAVIGKQV